MATALVPRTLQLPFPLSLSVPAHDTSVGPRSSLPEEGFSKTQSVKNQLPHTLGLITGWV